MSQIDIENEDDIGGKYKSLLENYFELKDIEDDAKKKKEQLKEGIVELMATESVTLREIEEDLFNYKMEYQSRKSQTVNYKVLFRKLKVFEQVLKMVKDLGVVPQDLLEEGIDSEAAYKDVVSTSVSSSLSIRKLKHKSEPKKVAIDTNVPNIEDQKTILAAVPICDFTT